MADWRTVRWDAVTHVRTLAGGEVVSFVHTGSGEGPVVLLVHGLGGSWRVWLENIGPLAREHRVLAVDLPGFGDSPPMPGKGGYDDYADLLARLCAEVGVTRVVAVGNSFGGWIVTELARSHPELVAGLVLIDAAGIPGTRSERIKVVSMLKLADRMAPVACRSRDVLSRRPRLRRQAFGFIVHRADQLAGDLALHLLPERPSPVFRPVLEQAVRSWSLAWCDQVAEMDVPALVIWGARDRQLPLRHAHEWVRLLRRSRLEVVPLAGHMPMLEQPAIVNDLLLKVLQDSDSHDDEVTPDAL